MNLILIIFDSLRQDHVGAYGNSWIKTPHLDAFAREAVTFTRCYPESLPTIQVRKALRTGKRGFPHANHRNYRGNVDKALPGWSPIPEEDDTLAEVLGIHGYVSCLVSDCYHQFKPMSNYQRGFNSYHLIRGQETDMYNTGVRYLKHDIEDHLNDNMKDNPRIRAFLHKWESNTAGIMVEEETFPAQVFRQSARWLEENSRNEKLFMIIDSFDPHEPWEPPEHYRKMYDPDDDVADLIQSVYFPWKEIITPRELKRMQANYAGEVSLCDRWFGYFIEALKNSGRLDDSVVVVMSDHGHNLGYDPLDKGYVSKQGHPMTRAVADLVCIVRHPAGEGAGTVNNTLFYNYDLTTTLLGMAGIEPAESMDGINIWPAVSSSSFAGRDHVTIGWGVTITVITDEWWYNSNIWQEGELLYSLKADPEMEDNVASTNPDVCTKLFELAKADAGGEFPEYLNGYKDRPGANINAWLDEPFGSARSVLSAK